MMTPRQKTQGVIPVDRRTERIRPTDTWPKALRGELCSEYLMEPDWEEGFQCTQEPGHDGPHRCATSVHAYNVGIDVNSRRYEWAYEWWSVDGLP